MSTAAYVGRVGGLAVALGVGAAVVTGHGGVAWADTPSTPSAADAAPAKDTAPPTTGTKSSKPALPRPSPADTTPALAPPGVVASTGGAQQGSTSTPRLSTPLVNPLAKTERHKSAAAPPELASPLTSALPSRNQADVEAPSSGTLDTLDVSGPVVPKAIVIKAPVSTFAAQAFSSAPTTPPPRSTLQSAALTPAQPPAAPDVVGIVSEYVSTFVSALLSPFASAGDLPAPPDSPAAWALLAWARRDFFNESPTVDYNPLQNTQSRTADGDVVITGNVGATDPDGDPLSYSVVGSPHNGGAVLGIDADGNFTYRPTNAMAAVGGTDEFTVLVSDEGADAHIHGLTGLLQFVPIVGNFLAPGGGHAVAQTITVTVTPVEDVDLSFPEGFHWGVASAGFQSEMGGDAPLDVNSDWYKWTHDPFNQLLGLTNGIPEDGPGAYNLFDTDAQLASEGVGANTFRLGVEWSRIFPNSTASVDISDDGGGVTLDDLKALDRLADPTEVAHYRAVFDSLRAHGLEPLVTVNHFSLPTWVHDPITARPLLQLGLPAPEAGWLSPDTPVEFQKYAAYLAWKYGDLVDNWVVLNEPLPPTLTGLLGIPIPGLPIPYWPPGVIRTDLTSTYLVNEAKAFVAGSREIHAWDTTVATPGQPAAFVGWANNTMPIRPADPTNPLDVAAAAAFDNYWNNWFPNAVILGQVDANLDGVITADEIHPEMANSADFYGLNYYASRTITGFGFAPLPGLTPLQGIPSITCDDPTCSDTGLPTDPGGFREVLEQAAGYGLPIWITENGIADAVDSRRASYVVQHVAVVQDLVAHGLDISGYTYWSLTDNLEWSSGYEPKFGLYSFDPATLVRTARPSVAVVHQITTANALPESLWQLHLPGRSL